MRVPAEGALARVMVWFLSTTDEPQVDSAGSLISRLWLRMAPVIKETSGSSSSWSARGT